MFGGTGGQGKIWHFDGTRWNEQYSFSLNGNTQIYLLDIYATSIMDIYAVGEYFVNQDTWGIILHYDGGSWRQITIPQIRTAFTKIRKDTNGKFYLLGVTNEQYVASTYQLYQFDGKVLTQIKSGSQDNDQFGGILNFGNLVYFIIGFDFYSYKDTSFTKIGRLSDSPEFLNVGFGRNVDDVFLGMRNGIAHYNGEDTEYLIKTAGDIWIRNGMIFEKDVFLMGRDYSNGNNLIYHGKLNE